MSEDFLYLKWKFDLFSSLDKTKSSLGNKNTYDGLG